MNIIEGKSDSVGKDEKSKKPKHRASLIIPKSVTDLQRIKLERLMQDPEKPIIIPPSTREKKTHDPPEFVRNVMGSSAGAGSGEFHVYRHLRRKEYSRQKYIDEKAAVENKNDQYHQRIEENKRLAEEKTAKKRAKRLKRKGKKKTKITKNSNVKPTNESEDSDEEDENKTDDENEDKNNEAKSEVEEPNTSSPENEDKNKEENEEKTEVEKQYTSSPEKPTTDKEQTEND